MRVIYEYSIACDMLIGAAFQYILCLLLPLPWVLFPTIESDEDNEAHQTEKFRWCPRICGTYSPDYRPCLG